MKKKLLFLISTLIFSTFFIYSIEFNTTNLLMIGEVGNFKISSNAIKKVFKANGLEICTGNGDQYSPQICCDGIDGAIIVWSDNRSGGNYDIFAQKIDATGNIQWTPNGVAICTANNDQESPQICCDGFGGAIIVWKDFRNGSNSDIYAQKINSTGSVKWKTNGAVICTANNNQLNHQICCDGSGGAIIAWQDQRISSANDSIYAQKINSIGTVQWKVNGTEICTENYYQRDPQICCDGSGGAIITWSDYRSGNNDDIYAQKINATGHIKWAPNGTEISLAILYQHDPQICGDGSGGAIIVWEDTRNGGGNIDIYAQKINATGDIKWTLDGTAISTENNYQHNAQICCDGSGGAIIVWRDFRSGTSYDIYTQKINATGNVQWTPNGVAICTATDLQSNPQICCDGSGGAFIVWTDLRNGVDSDIYAQKINSIGNIKWKNDGVTICTAKNFQGAAQICCDGSGGAIITWVDARADTSPYGIHSDIYAQKIIEVMAPSNLLLLAILSVGDEGFLGLSMGTWLIIGVACTVAIVIIILLVTRKK